MIPVLVVGSTFGAVHAKAVSDSDDMRLVGVLGSGSSRTRSIASRYQVPALTEVVPPPEPAAVASVVLRSTVLGGRGVDVARSLLQQGWSVLLEGPVRADEIKQLAKVAVPAGAGLRIGCLYFNLPAVARCFRIGEALRETSRVKHLRVLAATQTLSTGAAVLRRLCGGGVPEIDMTRTLNGVTTCVGHAGSTGFTLELHNEYDPADRDNGALALVGAELLADAGMLLLGDAAGPLVWVPRIRLGSRDSLGLPVAEPGAVPRGMALCDFQPRGFAQWLVEDWTQAVASDLRACARDAESGGADRAHLSASVADATWWSLMAQACGLPEVVETEASPVDMSWFDAVG